MILQRTMGDWNPVFTRGMGATIGQTGLQVGTSLGGAAAGVALGGSLALGAVTGGIGAIAALIGAWLTRKGPAQNVATTNIVNEAEPLMRQNLAAWNASTKTCAERVQAVQNFQQIWNAVAQNCAQPSLGDPGHSCLDDRLPAGVTFNYNTFNIVGNGMYDWFSYYLVPILNDPAGESCCIPMASQGIPGAPCYDPYCTSPVQVPDCTPVTPVSDGGAAAAGSPASIASAPAFGGLTFGDLLIPIALLVALWVVS